MYDTHINKRILEKIKNLEEPEKFKKLLIELLEFEKIQFNLGEKEYTKRYDGAITRYMEEKH